MEKDSMTAKIILLRELDNKKTESVDQVCDVADVGEFIVDMLDTLMRIAAKKDQSLLVYFLAMARIEAMELKNPDDNE